MLRIGEMEHMECIYGRDRTREADTPPKGVLERGPPFPLPSLLSWSSCILDIHDTRKNIGSIGPLAFHTVLPL